MALLMSRAEEGLIKIIHDCDEAQKEGYAFDLCSYTRTNVYTNDSLLGYFDFLK